MPPSKVKIPSSSLKTEDASKVYKKINREITLPGDEKYQNPYLNVDFPAAKSDNLKLLSTVKAHSQAISAIKFHPKKTVLATVSDDKSWKMFSFPAGELIMSGEGHKDWIADCDFHPR